MSPVDYAILCAGIAAIVFLSTALCWLTNRVDQLEADVSGLTDIVEKLVGERVGEVIAK